MLGNLDFQAAGTTAIAIDYNLYERDTSMEWSEILIRYGTFYNEIQGLGGFRTSATPTVDELFKNKSLKQRAYREMKQCDFPGTAIDYLAWLSSLYLIEIRRSFFGKGSDALINWLLDIIEIHDKYPAEVRNLVRLCKDNRKCYEQIIDTITERKADGRSPIKAEIAQMMIFRGVLSSLEILLSIKEKELSINRGELIQHLKKWTLFQWESKPIS